MDQHNDAIEKAADLAAQRIVTASRLHGGYGNHESAIKDALLEFASAICDWVQSLGPLDPDKRM